MAVERFRCWGYVFHDQLNVSFTSTNLKLDENVICILLITSYSIFLYTALDRGVEHCHLEPNVSLRIAALT
jgi:hypothetical protein